MALPKKTTKAEALQDLQAVVARAVYLALKQGASSQNILETVGWAIDNAARLANHPAKPDLALVGRRD